MLTRTKAPRGTLVQDGDRWVTLRNVFLDYTWWGLGPAYLGGILDRLVHLVEAGMAVIYEGWVKWSWFGFENMPWSTVPWCSGMGTAGSGNDRTKVPYQYIYALNVLKYIIVTSRGKVSPLQLRWTVCFGCTYNIWTQYGSSLKLSLEISALDRNNLISGKLVLESIHFSSTISKRYWFTKRNWISIVKVGMFFL